MAMVSEQQLERCFELGLKSFVNEAQFFTCLLDVPPILSSTPIWSPIPRSKEIGREEAIYRRADHWLSA